MPKLFVCLGLWVFPLSAMAADCIYYKNNDRTGDAYSLTGTGQISELPSGWNDTLSSVWVRKGFYSVIAKDYRFQGAKVYVYGSGLNFLNNTWTFDKAKDTGDGGMLHDLVPLGFNDQPTSLLCVKE